MTDTFNDDELGVITIKYNSRARRYTFRATGNGIQITSPVGIKIEDIKRQFDNIRHKLPRLQKNLNEKPRFEKDAVVKMFDFDVIIKESGYGNLFQSKFIGTALEFTCPAGTNYGDERVQAFFHKNLNKVLKYKAENYLPQRLDYLAKSINEKYKSCAVSYGKTRLGRCDSDRNILLSYRLMMLPPELVDYIILHELAHLKEMNHGEGFYRLLNKYCDGNYLKLERQFKDFKFPI